MLRAAQARLLPEAMFHEELGDLPNVPLLFVANELFDALPIQQWIAGEERRISATDEGRFGFTAGWTGARDIAGAGPGCADAGAPSRC